MLKIPEFFNNVKTILSEEEENVFKNIKNFPKVEKFTTLSGIKTDIENYGYCEKEVKDPENKTRTNILYINTKCNLRCEYCYEKENREELKKQVDCTKKDIDIFVEEIYGREKSNSCIVVMGGEPFLRLDLVEYLIDKVCNTPKNGNWAIDLITNGTLLTDKNIERIKKIKEKLYNSNNYFTLEISYDGSGHFRRKYPSGLSSKTKVESSLKKLMSNKIEFCLSYTCHSYNYKFLLRDLIFILENFKPTSINIGFSFEELDNILGHRESFKMAEIFFPYGKYLYDLYGIPLCGIVCQICKKCDRSISVGNTYYSPTKGLYYTSTHTRKEFDGFKNI